MSLRFTYFDIIFKRWVKKNTYVPKDVTKTELVMKASAFRTAPFDIQPVFERMFGPVDKEKLIPNIKTKCNELRKTYSQRLSLDKKLNLEHKIASEAIKLTNKAMGFGYIGKVKPVSIEEAVTRLPTSTSSGAPDYVTPKSELIPDCVRYLKAVMVGAAFLPVIKDFWPVTVVWRTQMRETGQKARIIAAFPQIVTILEMMYAKPFFDFYDQNIGQTSYSFGSTFQENSKLWEYYQNYKNVIGIDFDAFDTTVPGQLLLLFYTNLEEFLVMDPLQKYFFHWIRDYHMYAVVLNSEDGIVKPILNKKSGVLSGSVFTNFIDSWVNLFVLNYCLLKSGQSPDNYDIQVMGDDSLTATNEPADIILKEVTECAKTSFGMTIGNKSAIHMRGEPFFYMGFLTNNRFKLMKEGLMKDKMTITGRFIPETLLSNKMVVWSKFCSICSTCSNGFAFWLHWKDILISELGIEEPSYFHDLTEGPGKPFDVNRIINNASQYVLSAWKFT